MMRTQKGFTLIELVMVIVILGILAAVAIPKYIDLTGAANQAAVKGVAGSLGGASAINFTSRTLNVANGIQVLNCTTIANTLEGGLDPAYTITAAAIAAGTTTTCTVTGPSPAATTATFRGYGIN